MEYLLTAKEMQKFDVATIERIGIPALVLMERAAFAVYEEILKALGMTGFGSKKVLVLAGCGNNGADGLALARMLAEHGQSTLPGGVIRSGKDTEDDSFQVEVVVCGDPEKVTDAWKTQYEILKHFPVRTGSKQPVDEYDILVDALFGVGLSRDITGEYADLIRWLHERKGFKVAVDMPSGIHSDSGKVMGCAVKADLTVCFAFGKRGLYLYPGCEYAGKVVVKKIGIGEQSFGDTKPGMFRFTEKVTDLLPDRIGDGNKGTFGKVLLAAGNRNMAGAAVLAAGSCYRTGAGMVKVLTRECNRVILQTAVPEALMCIWEPTVEKLAHVEEDVSKSVNPDFYQWPDVLAIGPGLGTDEWAYGILSSFLKDSDLPLVIDADGLNLLSKYGELMELLCMQARGGRTFILTPHAGELARLCGITIDEVKENPVKIAMGLAQKLNCIIVSKDARTYVCQNKKPVCMNTTGNSGMAVAGSGDVLTGVIAGLLAQGMEPFAAAGVGVYLHGSAGDEAADRLGERGMTAGDLVQAVAEVTKKGGRYHGNAGYQRA